MFVRLFLIVLSAIGLLLTACAPARGAEQAAPLPTLFPTATTAIDLDAAQRAAVLYLEAWEEQNFPAMYGLISAASREALPYEDFVSTYEGVQNLMTLDQLDFSLRALTQSTPRMALLNYDVHFQTRILGNFDDFGRTLTLIFDSRDSAWRVAWSTGDIFPEMGSGATLRFESSPPTRANIYDRYGTVLADQNGIYVAVNVIKAEMPDLPACRALLAQALNEDESAIQEQFDRAGDNWVIEVGMLEPVAYQQQGDNLRRVCEATFTQKPVRSYPRGALMPHILGNVGYPEPDEVTGLVQAGFNQETIIGRSGIERSWDTVLRGTPGGSLRLVGPDGRTLRELARVSSRPAESIWLTIDAELQEYVLRTLGEAYVDAAEIWAPNSKGASAIVLDIFTGEILAMASYPTYEGNALNPFPAVGREVARLEQERIASDDRRPMLNRPIQGVYPSGSTFKVVPALASLDSGLYTPETTYVSTGLWRFGNDVRSDWLGTGHGRVNTATALTVSCNSCFYEVGFRMNEIDPYELPSYARRMGLGAPTGLADLPEQGGTIPDPDYIAATSPIPWSYSNAVNLAIGQGEVQVTLLQMSRMYAGIASDGVLYRPQIVRERGILNQRTFVADPDPNGDFGASQWVIDVLQEGLCGVTTRSVGTAEYIFRQSDLQALGVCGKTGTAEAPGQGGTHAWFIGWAPAERPEILVGVMVENAGEGSGVAAPLVRRIMEYYFFLRDT